ncbi:MAG: DUF4342 domain-containing protein [Clostridiales Family XIII bacterium]|nr:DUF4342 domain-containing protein [Clostridiales Family XIII bacterium]
MEITLEKIELVKDRTGVSYREAKEALEAADGSVVDAIINIEETINMGGRDKAGERESQLLKKIRAAVRKGNVSRIRVRKDDFIILNLPVNAGIVGAVLAPWAALAGVIAAFGTRCVIELVKDDGEVVEISERASDTIDEVLEKGADIVDEVVDRGSEVFDSVRAKTQEAISKVKRASRPDGGDDDDDAWFENDDGDYVFTAAGGAKAEGEAGAAESYEGAEGEDAEKKAGDDGQ